MKTKEIMSLLLALMLLLTVLTPALAANDYIRLMPDVTFEMTSPDFWLDKLDDPSTEILTAEQVAALNQEGYEDVAWLYKLAERDWTQTREGLEKTISYAIPNMALFVDGEKISDEYIAALEKNRNIGAIQDSNPARYGFVTYRTDMTSQATSDIVSDAADDPAYNQFQMTALLVGEPLVVFHESLDGKLLFCGNFTCFGWVPKSDVAVCRDKNGWIAAQDSEDFLLVTGNRIITDQNPFDARISGTELTMGTKLPLVPVSEVPDMLYGRRVYENYVVKMPVTGADGYTEFVYLPIPVSADVHIGYLPFTYENVLNQLFKMQGDRYGWGGMFYARDCSSLTQELYYCFGIDLPRNGAWQTDYAGRVIDVTGMNNEAKLDILTRKVKPGALIQFPGHITVYLGEHDGKPYVMSASGNIAEYSESADKYEVKRTRSVIISTLEVQRASGHIWLDDILKIVCLDDSYTPPDPDDPNAAAVKSVVDASVFDVPYDPDREMTRGEFADALAYVQKLDFNAKMATDTFSDVTVCAGAIGALYAKGYMLGVGGGRFDPDTFLRNEYAKVVLERAGLEADAISLPEEGNLTMENAAIVFNKLMQAQK